MLDGVGDVCCAVCGLKDGYNLRFSQLYALLTLPLYHEA
jgi:hypothetical protein